MFVYQSQSREEGLAVWEVGYFTPRGEWWCESVHTVQEKAVRRVCWLNGGGMRVAALEKQINEVERRLCELEERFQCVREREMLLGP